MFVVVTCQVVTEVVNCEVVKQGTCAKFGNAYEINRRTEGSVFCCFKKVSYCFMASTITLKVLIYYY